MVKASMKPSAGPRRAGWSGWEIFPGASSIAALVVMFGFMVKIDLSIALLSLSVVPFLYLSLRHYMRTLSGRIDGVKNLESKLQERLYEVFAAMRLVKSFGREPFEGARYRTAGDEVMNARIDITWQESLFSAVISMITILGTALVVIVGGLHVIQGRMTVGQLLVVISYLGFDFLYFVFISVRRRCNFYFNLECFCWGGFRWKFY